MSKDEDLKSKARDKFYETIQRVEDDLEKKITYISAGSLVLSITFMEKIVDLASAEYFSLLIIGWTLLGITLALNLISTLVSRELTLKNIRDYDAGTESDVLIKKITKRNNIIRNLDLGSLITLLLGILFVILFCSVNLQNHKKDNTMSERDIIEKGRVANIPLPSTNTGNSGGNTAPNPTTTPSPQPSNPEPKK